MSIVVEMPGALTTVQDLGRIGYQRYGVPEAGAVDKRSAALANLLVGNGENEGCLECTLLGPTLRFEESAVIAVTGGDLGALLDGKPCPRYRAVDVKAGQKLRFSGLKNGCRAYIAFAGGLELPLLMGSMSTYRKAAMGGFEGRELRKDDCLTLRSPGKKLAHMAGRVLGPDFAAAGEYVLHVIPGPQDDRFSEEGIRTFFSEVYTVTQEFDRMGCRLEGPEIGHLDSADIISDGIVFGSIQVPSAGKPIIMLADRQTTGGYTKIATVISADHRILGQLKGGDKVRFKEVSLEYARAARQLEQNRLRQVRDFMKSLEQD